MDPVKGLADNFAQQINLGGRSGAHSNIPTSNFPGNVPSGSSTMDRNVQMPKKTDWKLDAPEFVPRSFTALSGAADASQQAASSTVDFRAIEEASEQVGQLEHPSGVKSRSTANYARVLEENLDYTDSVVAELQNNPESIENLSSQLLEYIYDNVIDNTALTTIFARLLDAAITVPNFAFVCVRLMVWINDNFDSKRATLANFQRDDCRDCIISVLEAEFKTRKESLRERKGKGDEPPSNEETQRLFVYVNALCMFSTLMSFQGKPFKVLVFAIYEILRKVVEQRLDNYVRFGIQTLKTVGAHLESTEKLETQPENNESQTPLMDKLIDVLECIGTEPDSLLSDNTKFMIRNLRGVRRHWAYVAPPPPSPVQQQPPQISSSTNYYDDQQSSQYLAPDNVGLSQNNSSSDLAACGGYLDISNSSLPPSAYLHYVDDNYATNEMSLVASYFPPTIFPGDPLGAAAAAAAQQAAAMNAVAAAQAQQQSALGGDGAILQQQQQQPPSNANAAALYFTPASLTPAEAAFFERVCFDGAVNDAAPVVPHAGAPGEDDTIADAYEEFLRHINRR